MNKAIPAIVIAAAVVGLGVLGAVALLIPSEDPAEDAEGESSRGALSSREFLTRFDTDGNGIVSFEEFEAYYGEEIVLSHPDGTGDMTAEEAFAGWDLDGNGVVDRRDLENFEEEEWAAFAEEAESRGLFPHEVRGEFLALNKWQESVWQTERAADSRHELPWAGGYFAEKYFDKWADVTLPDGTRTDGFVSEDRGRLWLLTDDARLRVFEPKEVTVRELGNDVPEMEYARAIRQTPFDRPDGNLELARKAVEWGLDDVAEMLYARVLIFEPDHEAALETVGLHYDGREHQKKEE